MRFVYTESVGGMYSGRVGRMRPATLQALLLNIVDRIGRRLELKRLKIIVTFPLFCGSST